MSLTSYRAAPPRDSGRLKNGGLKNRQALFLGPMFQAPRQVSREEDGIDETADRPGLAIVKSSLSPFFAGLATTYSPMS